MGVCSSCNTTAPAADGEEAKHTRTSTRITKEEVLEAAGSGRVPALERLIAARANVNCADPNGSTPLHRCVENNTQGTTDPETGKVTTVPGLLLQSKADIKAVMRNGFTPLHSAAMHRNTDVCKLLLQAKASVHAKARDDSTPLHCAASKPHPWQLRCQVASLLLAAKANPNAQNQSGATPIHCTATKGISLPQKDAKKFQQALDECIIFSLVNAKANPSIKNKRGKTPLEVANQCGHELVAGLIRFKGGTK